MEQLDHSRLSEDELSKIHRGRVGRYELFFRIGMGGMASVYLGRLGGEVGFERWVAIKQIHEHLAEEQTFREMFLDEARVAVQLSHPNLVQVTDVGIEGGRPYLVMEFIKGETLARILKRCYKRKLRLPIPIAARIIAWACEGLHVAHDLRDPDGNLRGLVHRDLSPHNILVSYDGVVKVADFGIAKAAGRTTHTRTGIVKGKPQYMSPEQALAKPVDRRSDVFSLGILLYEATLGRRLFKEDSEFETFRRITSGSFPRPRAVERGYPPSLERAVLGALAVNPKDRFQSARELQVAIEKYMLAAGETVSTADVAEFMAALFEDRLQAHEELLAWARSSPVGAPPAEHALIVDQTGSTSMSLGSPGDPGAVSVSGIVEAGEGRDESRRSKLALVGVIVAIMVAAIGVGALAVKLAAPGGSGDVSADQASPDDRASPNVADLIGTTTGTKATAPSGDEGEEDRSGGDVLVFDAGASHGTEQPADDAGLEGADAEVWVFELDAGVKTKRHRPPDRRRDPQPRGSGTVSVMCTPWCEVQLDGRALGRTPLMRVSVSSGRHTVVLLPRGKGPGQRRSIRVEPGKNTPVSLAQR